MRPTESANSAHLAPVPARAPLQPAIAPVAEGRLVRLGVPIAQPTGAELERHFGAHADLAARALHYVVELGGEACLLSLWDLADVSAAHGRSPYADLVHGLRDREVQAVSEIFRFAREAGLFQLLSHAGPASDTLDAAMHRFMDEFWDSASTSTLIEAVKGSSDGAVTAAAPAVISP